MKKERERERESQILQKIVEEREVIIVNVITSFIFFKCEYLLPPLWC